MKYFRKMISDALPLPVQPFVPGNAMRLFAACLLLLVLLTTSAGAYTLVMRGGRRVEIADGFRLNGAQLTYEVAPGVSVTLPLDLIDVAATERANGEPSGGFLRRAAAASDAHQRRAADSQNNATSTKRMPARTLTNRELEPTRQARIESERAYERRRVELGLPSAEEARQRDQEEARAMHERARQQAEGDAEAEGYWRGRAATLREEAAALDAETSYLRGLLAERSNGSSVGFSSFSGLNAGALTVIAGVPPRFGRGGFVRTLPDAPFFARNPANLLMQNVGDRFGYTNGRSVLTFNINGGTRAGFGYVRRNPRGQFARPTHRNRFVTPHSAFFAPGFVSIVAPFDYTSADTLALSTRLRLLEGERAGLAARWRQLEEEARRAGALPGWLRP